MKYLHVASILRGGAGKLIANLACEQKLRGHEVGLVSSGSFAQMEDWNFLLSQLHDQGVLYAATNLLSMESASFWQSVSTMVELLDEFKPDLIHAHSGLAAASAIMANDLRGTHPPMLSSFYSWEPSRKDWAITADIWAFTHCSKILTHAEYCRNYLTKYGVDREKIALFPFGLKNDQQPQTEVRQKLRDLIGMEKNKEPVIVNVASVEPLHEQMKAYETLRQVHNRIKAHLVIIGDIADEEYCDEIKEQARNDSMQHYLHFLGHRDNHVELASDADVMIQPGSPESVGMVLVEAMRSKVPIVCSENGILSDSLRTNVAMMSGTSETPDSFAEAIVSILDDKNYRESLIAEAFNYVSTTYDWNNYFEKTMSEYDKLLVT